MTYRAHVSEDFGGVSVTFGIRTDTGLLVAKPVLLEYEIIPEAVSTIPTLRIDEGLARALLDALSAHFVGASDSRTLREDYLHERNRVDKFIDSLLKED